MSEHLRPDEIEARCERLQYPVMRADAAATFADTTVETEEGAANLGVVISELDHDSFASPEELYAAVAASVDSDL
jgi:hypothetical protein